MQRFVVLVLFSLIVLSFGCGDTAEETPAAPIEQNPTTDSNLGGVGEPQTQVLPLPVFSKMVELIDEPAIRVYYTKKVLLPYFQAMNKGTKATWKIDDFGTFLTERSMGNGKTETGKEFIKLADHQCNATQGSAYLTITKGGVYRQSPQDVSDNYEDIRASYYWTGKSWQLSKLEETPFWKRQDDPKRKQWKLVHNVIDAAEKQFFSELADTAAKSFQ